MSNSTTTTTTTKENHMTTKINPFDRLLADPTFGLLDEKFTRMATVLNSLPSYSEVDIMTDMRDGMTFRCMVRDRPTYKAHEPRRLTNLDTGTEWFIDPDALANVEATSVSVVSFDNRGNDPLWFVS